MNLRRYPLNTSVSATFIADGTGLGTARAFIGPQVYGVAWKVTRLVVTTTNSATQGASRLFVYRNVESASSQVDSSYNGDQNVSETDLELATLDTLIFVWTGGDIGTVATAILSGEVEERR